MTRIVLIVKSSRSGNKFSELHNLISFNPLSLIYCTVAELEVNVVELYQWQQSLLQERASDKRKQEKKGNCLSMHLSNFTVVVYHTVVSSVCHFTLPV